MSLISGGASADGSEDASLLGGLRLSGRGRSRIGRVLTADDLGMRLTDAATLAVFDEIRPGWAIAGIAVSAAGDLVALVGNDHAEPAERSGRLATLSLPGP